MSIDIIIASHISITARIKLLKRCLQSIKNQTVQPKHVFLSYSYDFEEDYEVPFNNDTFQKELLEIYPSLIILYRPERHTQFQHICRTLVENKTADWICFQDDDDISLPNRIERFTTYNANCDCDYFISGTNIIASTFDQSLNQIYERINSDNVQFDFASIMCKVSVFWNIVDSIYNRESVTISDGGFDIRFRAYLLANCVGILDKDHVTYIYCKEIETIYVFYKNGKYEPKYNKPNIEIRLPITLGI